MMAFRDAATTRASDRWERLGVVFGGALTLPAVDRDAYVRARCEDPRDVAEINALLKAYPSEPGPVERLMEALGPEPSPALVAEAPTRVGPYEVLRELGSGGMGVVYLARRADGVYQRLVALKLARTHTQEPAVHARFVAERDILAGLTHPSIVPLFDGGVTEDGRPYFTMEYVDGQPIHRHCDAHRLDLRERIRLFLSVCGAVAAAHRSLVVHLDLKPTNILVTADGNVRLLDFGIARLLGSSDGMGLDTVVAGARMLTPAYASPEQVTGGRVSTATDVYALGLVLYELLCGRRAQRVSEGEVDQWQHVVVHADPLPMADAVAQPGLAAGSLTAVAVSFARRSTPRRLTRDLDGDLADIAAKAMHKDPDQRYATAAQMAEDLERYLDGRPVAAHPASALYRLRRFAGRHRLEIVAAALLVSALVGYSVMAARYARDMQVAAAREQQNATRSEAVADFLVGLFEASDPDVVQNRQTPVAEMLDQGLQQANTLAAQPQLQARLLNAIGRAYFNLGRYADASSVATRALAASRQAYGDRHPDVARDYRLLGLVTGALGQQAEAGRLFQTALDIRTTLDGAGSVEAATDRHYLGYALAQSGQLAEAESHVTDALATRRRLLPPGHEDIATSLSALAFVRGRQDRPKEAVGLYREALAMRVLRLGERHPEVARARQNLAAQLRQAGQFDEAAVEMTRALGVYRAAYGERHPSIATTLNNLGTLEAARSRDPDAIRYYRAALVMRRELLGPEHPSTLLTQANLAAIVGRSGRPGEGEALLRDVLARSAGRDDVAMGASRTQTMANLANLLRLQAKLVESEAVAREALALGRAREDGPLTEATIMATLGRTLTESRQHTEAIDLLTRALEIRQERLGPDHPATARVREFLDEARRLSASPPGPRP